MEPNPDVSQSVPADGVNQGVASPESSQEADKDYNFRTVVADRDKYKDEADQYRAKADESEKQVNMYRAMGYPDSQQPQGNQPPQQQAPQQQSFGDLKFDDAVDSEAFNKLAGAIGQQAQALTQQTTDQQMQVERLSLQLQDPNYHATIDKYLPDAIKKNPWIGDEIRNSPKGWSKAYYHATHTPQYHLDKATAQQSQDAQRMVDNANKPQSLGSVGTQSNVGTQRDAFDMSQEEFELAKQRLVSGNYEG